MAHTRAKLSLETGRVISDFVREINSDGTTDRWAVENFDGSLCVNARSLLGMMYACTEWNGEIYLFNASNKDAPIPTFVDKYRA